MGGHSPQRGNYVSRNSFSPFHGSEEKALLRNNWANFGESKAGKTKFSWVRAQSALTPRWPIVLGRSFAEAPNLWVSSSFWSTCFSLPENQRCKSPICVKSFAANPWFAFTKPKENQRFSTRWRSQLLRELRWAHCVRGNVVPTEVNICYRFFFSFFAACVDYFCSLVFVCFFFSLLSRFFCFVYSLLFFVLFCLFFRSLIFSALFARLFFCFVCVLACFFCLLQTRGEIFDFPKCVERTVCAGT